jgi:hypothetical protein
MSESFSRSQFPPGGWEFYHPQTAWEAPTPKASTFDQTVNLIIKHRLANPGAVSKHNLATDPVLVGNELENYTRLRLGMQPMGAGSPPKTIPPRSLPQGVREAVAASSRMVEGVALLIDWLPGGQTVAPELSAKRAAVCAECPKNSEKEFGSWFTKPVSERLRRMVEARADLKLATPHDEKLGVCGVCLCPMKLKVHVPMDYILGHTKPQTLAELPPHCWIAKRDA